MEKSTSYFFLSTVFEGHLPLLLGIRKYKEESQPTCGVCVPSGLPTSRSTALALVPAPLLTKGEPGSGSVRGDNPSPSRVKTGGRGGSGEGCVSRDGGGAPQSPTAGHGNANLTFSFSCHLVASGTLGDCAKLLFPPARTPSTGKTASRKTTKLQAFPS